MKFLLSLITIFTIPAILAQSSIDPIPGTKCAKNQVVNKVTVYEDGAIEAECGPIPCATSGETCIDDQIACKAERDVFSGMKWASNGQSILLRCCNLNVSNKLYVGTDLVTLGSYYTGGPVAKKDLYGNGGPEYDFVANIRTEQGGVRLWVYRILCPLQQETVPSSTPVSQITDGRNFAYEKRRQYLLRQLSQSQQQQSSGDLRNNAMVGETRRLQ
ncbi:Hypothetical protein SRAE_X000005600 [Strongyloides ratti]|uniref:Uncharacterized protein n=1 Tax=Strongyloides ratti TaxID=34506 RepID=A0A090LLQ3_STRRB|nr:Hypothetical protein SRAE_X000005600 [Strongyloides ratti]CEF70725.1 Hypothetical protein SRAE_X000005600 [Strongyloides ratti]